MVDRSECVHRTANVPQSNDPDAMVRTEAKSPVHHGTVGLPGDGALLSGAGANVVFVRIL